MQLRFSTAFHPQTDGQSKRTIQILEDMLRACVLEFEGSCQSSIQMALYEALYGRKCRSPVGWFEVGARQLLGPDMVKDAVDKVKLIRDHMRTA